jgi:CHASE3 domain sensor protein
MKITKTFLTGILFLFLGIFLLSFFLFLYSQIKSLNESSELVTRTNTVKLKLTELVIALKDVETLQREYLLAQDTLLLAPYRGAYNHFWKSLEEIDSLVKDDPTQQINILAVKVFSKEGLMALDHYANADKSPKADMTSYFLESNSKMDRIRMQINLMSRYEDSLLRKRVEEGNE